jgi:hypothetical protein
MAAIAVYVGVATILLLYWLGAGRPCVCVQNRENELVEAFVTIDSKVFYRATMRANETACRRAHVPGDTALVVMVDQIPHEMDYLSALTLGRARITLTKMGPTYTFASGLWEEAFCTN